MIYHWIWPINCRRFTNARWFWWNLRRCPKTTTIKALDVVSHRAKTFQHSNVIYWRMPNWIDWAKWLTNSTKGLIWLSTMVSRGIGPTEMPRNSSHPPAIISAQRSMWVFDDVQSFSPVINLLWFVFRLQLLMFFVPKMRYSLNGHVVSIQSSSNTGASKPLLDSSEIQRVVQLLASTDTQTYTNEIDVSTGAPVHIQRSTVLCDQFPNSKNLADVTEQIIAGIQHERSLIKIENSKSLIQFVCSFFFK